MPDPTDPTFYRSPNAAIAAPPEQLAHVAALDPAGRANDALVVVDCDCSSPTYGGVIGWTELPTAGNELHHFGWSACSIALCHEGHGGNRPLERRYLVVPGIRSSTPTNYPRRSSRSGRCRQSSPTPTYPSTIAGCTSHVGPQANSRSLT
jgi:hypothetical protein